MGSSQILKRAIDKYGLENFKKEILFIFDTEQEMSNKEAELVTQEVVNNPFCYNLKLGGIGKWGTSDSQRTENGLRVKKNKMGIFSKENHDKTINNPEWINKYSLKNKDRQLAAYQKCWGNSDKKSEIIAQRKAANFQKGSKNSQFGTCWITNGHLNKKIKLEDLSSHIEKGWKRGRLVKF